jgi:hypothetical protein
MKARPMYLIVVSFSNLLAYFFPKKKELEGSTIEPRTRPASSGATNLVSPLIEILLLWS